MNLKDAPAAIEASASSSPLRVLHVLEATLGGTLRYMENIAECLRTADLQLGFAYGTARADSRLEPLLTNMKHRGWNLYPVPMRREINIAAELECVRHLRRTFQEFRPDVVHCHSSKAGVLGRVASLLVRPAPAVVYSPHALAIPLGRKYLYIEQLLRKLAGRFIAVSDSEAGDIVHYQLANPDRITVAYPLIDCDYFTPSDRDTSDRSTGPFTVMGVGRLTAQKDPLRFITIVRRLQKMTPGVEGVWVGDGELRRTFEQEITITGPPSIRLLPWQRDIRPFLSSADVLLSTSIYESFGYMVAEALALEVPVVASRISGTSDILIGEFAENMYEPGDEANAAALLQRVLQDPVRARQWAVFARAMVRDRFNARTMRDALLDAYCRATGAGKQSGARSKTGRASEIDHRLASEKGSTAA